MPDYQYSHPVTIGGVTGAYSAVSPFPARSEVAVLSVAFTDVGYAVVSPDPSPPSLGNTQALNGDALRGIAFTGAANANPVPDALFWPLDGPQTVYVNMVVASNHTGYVSVVFRTPLTEHIWESPAEQPVTAQYGSADDKQRAADALSAILRGR